MTPKFEFSFVPNIFKPYEKATANEKNKRDEIITKPQLDIIKQNYGVDDGRPAAPRDQTQWARFEEYVKHLNATSDDNVSYKLFYVLRHGIGVYKVVMEALEKAEDAGWLEAKAWNNHFSFLNGAEAEKVYLEEKDLAGLARSVTPGEKLGRLQWVDALLADEGITQAKALAEFWNDEAKIAGMPRPESIYTSPLARCLETTRLVYGGMLSEQLQPVVKEALRERLNNHTCNQRSPRAWIEEMYPEYTIERGFEERDILWKKDEASKEDEDQHVERKRRLLEDIFEHDTNQVISLTTHSFALTAILMAIGAPKFRIRECVLVPLFVKAVRIAHVEATNVDAS